MTKDISWILWRSFLSVIETGSLSAAARRLSMTQPTLGRHIDGLEQALGVPLFTRSIDGLAPTSAAQALIPQAKAMAASADALQRLAGGSEHVRGSVRLTASEIVSVQILPPLLSEMRQTHPELSVELVVSNMQDDLVRRDADIAIRMVRPTQKRLIAQKMGEVAIGLYAHVDYLREKPPPTDTDALFEHDLIGTDRDISRLAGIKIGTKSLQRDKLSFRCDSDIAQLAALKSGLVIGVCQTIIADNDDELIRILPDAFSIDLEVWLVMHEDLKTHQSARAAYDFLSENLRNAIAQ